jgi:hypothetical protein
VSEGGQERVEEGGVVAPPFDGFKMGQVTVRVEDRDGVREFTSPPEAASESAGADATGNGEA